MPNPSSRLRAAFAAAILVLPIARVAAKASPLPEIRLDRATYNPLSLVLKRQGVVETAFAGDGTAVRWVQSRGSSKALELWRKDAPTILMVTHGIEEAALLGDRVAVLRPNPGRVAEIIVNAAPRPRRDGADMLDLRGRLRSALDGASTARTERNAG